MATQEFSAYLKGVYGIIARCTSIPDVQSNSSKVTVDVYLDHPYINIGSRNDGYISIDGSKTTYRTAAIKGKSGTDPIATRTVTIKHDDEGKRKVAIEAMFPYDLENSTYGKVRYATVTGEFELDTIWKASEIVEQTNVVTVDGVAAWSATLAKKTSAYRHKATLSFNGLTMESGVFDTTVSMVIPLEWLHAMTDTTEAAAFVSIQTYTDESCAVAVGNAIESRFTVRVPADAAPGISTGWAVINPYNAGAAAGMGVYVQGYSGVQAVFDPAKVQLKYGATDATFRVETDDFSAEGITPILAKSGTQIVRCVVTDSRGLESHEAFEIMVYPYSPPTLLNPTIYRCDSSGAENDRGEFLFFSALCNYSDCGGENTVSLSGAWKSVNSPTYSNATALANGEGSVLGAGSVNRTKSYNAKITAVDRLGNRIEYESLIGTAEMDFHLLRGGGGGAFGKYAEEKDLLDCVWRFKARGGIVGLTKYALTEAEHGVWIDGRTVHSAVFECNAISDIEVTAGKIDGFSMLISATGAVQDIYGKSYAIQKISVDANGEVLVTADVSGTAHAIVTYIKEG